MNSNPLMKLLSNEYFIQEMTNAFIQLFNTIPDYFVNKDNVKAKVFNLSDNNNLLIVQRGKMLEIYREESYSTNIFSYAKESLMGNQEIYSSYIMIVNTQKNKMMSDDELFEILKKKGMQSFLELPNDMEKRENYIKHLRGILSDENNLEKITTSPYEIRFFQKFLKDNGFLKEIIISDSDLMDLSTKSFKSQLWADMRLTTDFMMNALTKNKIQESNQLVFNDGDNPIYMNGDKLVFICQNTSTIVVKNGQEYTYYGIAHDNTDAKKYKSLEDLEKSINSNDDYMDNVVFKANGDTVIFSDSAFQYILELNIRFFKNWLEEHFDVVADYPVDIYSYEYQLKYAQKRYGLGEFDFITYCLLTLGNGVSQADGRFYEPGVKFSPEYENVELAPHPEKIENMGYCYLLETEMELNDDWKKAAQYMVDVLKRDRPKSTIFEGDDFDSALNKVIEYWENKAQPKKKNTP